MVFNPGESIDFHGYTAPFIQYTHARIKSILRKESAGGEWQVEESGWEAEVLLPLEKQVIMDLARYPEMVAQACQEHNPSVIANFVFNLARIFNSFYSEHSVANAASESKKKLRLRIAVMTANTIQSSMQLLGIRVPERM
jgi:arginyl-tRNA synthetase